MVALKGVEQLLSTVGYGKPRVFQNMLVIPLLARDTFVSHPGRYRSFTDSIADGTLTVGERAVVGELPVRNDGDQPVFILAGSEVLGLAQQRMVPGTAVIDANVQGSLPVRCVQRKRWDTHAPQAAYVSTEAANASSIIFNGSISLTQAQVWEIIADLNETTGAKSRSESLADVQRHLAPMVDEYVSALLPPLDPELIGVVCGVYPILTVAGDFHLTLDLFGQVGLCQTHVTGRIRSAAETAASVYSPRCNLPPRIHRLDRWAKSLCQTISRVARATTNVRETMPVSRAYVQTGTSATGKQVAITYDLGQPLHAMVHAS